jgi:hypothetical protein
MHKEQTNRQTDKQTNRQTDKQTNRQTFFFIYTDGPTQSREKLVAYCFFICIREGAIKRNVLRIFFFVKE